MKTKEFIALIITGAIATVVILWLQPYLFSSVIPFSMNSRELDNWLGKVFWPTTWMIYGLGVFLTLIWIGKAAKSRYSHANQVLANGGLWWLLCIFCGLLSLIGFLIISFFTGWLNDGQSLEPLWILPPFIVVDVVLLYWLPTAIATPRSFRYLPPFSMTLRKLYGG